MESAGFWSYAHEDDDAERGRIVRLADLIKREYSLLTGGEEIAIFTDHDIQWGEEWRRRINTNLEDVTFFIPIITPRYFKRQECRKELITFAGHAASLGVRELLLPVLYIPVPNLAEESDDEAIALVAAMQYVDCSALRLAPEDSSEYRRAVNRLAERLRDIAETVSDRPEPPPVTSPAEALEGDDELGLLDSTALGEEVAPLWGEALTHLGELADAMGPIINEAVEEMNHAQTSGAKLAAARRFAQRIKEPSERFEETAEEYASQALRLDPAILRMIRGATEIQSEDGDIGEFVALFAVIHEAAGILGEFASSAGVMQDGVRSMARLTKELRPVIRTLSSGAQKIQDSQSVVDEWDRQIIESGLLPPTDESGDNEAEPS